LDEFKEGSAAILGIEDITEFVKEPAKYFVYTLKIVNTQ
jgi:hypothetical protein